MNILEKSAPLIILMAVMCTSLYVVANNLPALIGSFRFVWGPSVLLFIFLIRSSVFKQKAMKLLIFYGVLYLGIFQYTLWSSMNEWNRASLLEEFYSVVIFLSIFYFYYVKRDFYGFAYLSKYCLYFIIITVALTHVALFFDPLVVRMSVNSSAFNSYQAMLFKRLGPAGYGYMQALVCLIPVLIFYIRSKTRIFLSKSMLIVVLCGVVFAIIRAQVLANLAVTVAIIILSFAIGKNFKKSAVFVAITGISLFSIPNIMYVEMLENVSSYFDTSSVMHAKLNDLAISIQYPDFDTSTGANARASRYPLLFEAFIAEPILGDSSYSSPFDTDAGSHLYWMKRLSMWGLPGFLFFMFVVYFIYKNISRMFDDHFRTYYLLSCTAFILLGLMKNIAGREPFLMLIVVVPGLYFLPLLQKKHFSFDRSRIGQHR